MDYHSVVGLLSSRYCHNSCCQAVLCYHDQLAVQSGPASQLRWISGCPLRYQATLAMSHLDACLPTIKVDTQHHLMAHLHQLIIKIPGKR